MARPDALNLTSDRTAFLIRAVLWSVGLFGLMRVPWVEQTMVNALLGVQSTIVRWYVTSSASAVTITPSCSATDVMSMCLGVVLSFPATWTRRLIGAVGGIAMILALNIVRIATLAVVATKWPSHFDSAHVVVWPVILAAATTAYVWWWIRGTERSDPRAASHRSEPAPGHSRARRFAWIGVGLLALHLAVAPWTMTSSAMEVASRWTARTAGIGLEGVGIHAHADGALLTTSRGAFLVTPECLLTPLIPLYLAGVFSVALSRRRRIAALLATIPIFFVLGVIRVLVLAVPAAAIASPLYLVHGFFQFVFGVVAVAVACRATVDAPAIGIIDWTRFSRGIGIGLAAALVGAWPVTRLTLMLATTLSPWFPHVLTTLAIPNDLQGVLVIAPAYQLGLVFALLSTRRAQFRVVRAAIAVGGVMLSLITCLVVTGAWIAHTGALPHALFLRAWSVTTPIAIAWLLVRVPERSERVGSERYHRFWHHVGDEFPDLGGAASTDVYAEHEQRLLTEHVPDLDGCRIFKTDLWDEARNTRILQWASAHGASPYGIDISAPTVVLAHAGFRTRPRFGVADVRRLPFADGVFDVVYSMGTVEHFEETDAAVAELARVLRPGGRLILGVPNRFDPFLRPVLAWLMQRAGLYDYGYEKCYSRAALRAMIERTGLSVVAETGILFMPGWLRMADLWCHTRCRPLTSITAPCVRVFGWLGRRFPRLQRHGYLLASVGVKPV